MRVSPQGDYGLNPVAAPGLSPANAPRTAAGDAGSEALSLTAQGQELQRLTQQIAGLPEPASSSRAAEVSAQLAAGTYTVSGSAIASRLMQRLFEQ